MDGRKIPYHFENPFDIVFIEIAMTLNTYVFKPLGFVTPNIITSLSLITGLASLYCFYKQLPILFAVLFLISYILDCADGNYARRYHMVTRFGDYYDHGSDMFKLVGLLVLVWISPGFSQSQKIFFYAVTGLLTCLANVHLGCQEKVYGLSDESGFLVLTSLLCPSGAAETWIPFTRYFGVGTLQVFIVVYIVYIIF